MINYLFNREPYCLLFKWGVIFLLITLVIGCATQEEPKPNILLIVADDLGWNDVGYHGSEIRTPAIDNLAKTGNAMEQFYVSPTCSPTRAALLSGRAPSRFGILGPIMGKSRQVLPVDIPTLASVLKDNGYATAVTGKWHLGLRPENGPRKYGFDYTYGYLHGQIDPYTHRYKFGDRTWHRNDVFVDEHGHATDLITNEAIQYIKNSRDKNEPFFLYVPYNLPHFPLNEEDKWLQPYKESIENPSRLMYAGAVAHLDDATRQLIKTLDDEQLRENTLVIFISDNGAQENWLDGAAQYEGRYAPNDRLGDNTPLRGWKAGLYEGGIRVPAIFNWPAKFKAGQINELTSVKDIFPTVAYFAGSTIPANANLEGVNIAECLLQGKPVTDQTLYWRTPQQYALRKGDWKLVLNGATLGEGTSELFNIAGDPNETKDVAAENPELVKNLLQELKKQAKEDSESEE